MLAPDKQNVWLVTCRRFVAELKTNLWQAPLWMLPDTRHKSAAEQDILRLSDLEAIPTNKIVTLLQFAGQLLDLVPVEVTISPAEAILLLQKTLAEETPSAYSASYGTPGFIENLWYALEEAEARGFFPDAALPTAAAPAPSEELRSIQARLHTELSKRGRYTAGQLLFEARSKLLQEPFDDSNITEILIGPFFEFTPLEKAFVQTLKKQSKVMLHWLEPASAIDQLSDNSRQIFSIAPFTPEEELHQIFTCIAEKVVHKTRRYRDFRIIHPDWKNRLSEIESTARHYHVPLRLIVKHSLSEFAGVVLLDRLIGLFNNRWQRDDLLDLLHSRLITAPGGQVSAAINLMLAKDAPPGKPAAHFWNDQFAAKALTELSSELQKLFDLDQSCSAECSGTDFAVWLNRCLDYVCDHTQLAETVDHPGWFSLRRLIEQYDSWDTPRQSRRKHLNQFNLILHATNYQNRQNHADAVELCSNAREDFVTAKVLFYCGLTSRVPAKRRISAFDSEAAGTSYRKQFELFSSQLVSADDEIYLFSPQYDDKGNETARSPFQQSLAQNLPERIIAKELPAWPVRLLNRNSIERVPDKTLPIGQITSPIASSYLAQSNQTWSVSRLERARQCPYLHFSHDILKLNRPIDQVTEGATQALMGSLAHKALELWVKHQGNDQEFNLRDWIRSKAEISIGWTETHLELDRSLEELITVLDGFTAKGPWDIITGFKPAEVEYELRDAAGNIGLLMQSPTGPILWMGQLDRIDEDEAKRLIIIDYKYKKAPSKNEFYDDFEAGLIPQLPIYSYLLQENQKKTCIGWLQIFLRSEAIFGYAFSENFDVSIPFSKDAKLQAADAQTKAELHAKVFQTAEEQRELVSLGKFAPKPRDLDRCGPGNCDYADLCRYRQIWIKTLK